MPNYCIIRFKPKKEYLTYRWPNTKVSWTDNRELAYMFDDPTKAHQLVQMVGVEADVVEFGRDLEMGAPQADIPVNTGEEDAEIRYDETWHQWFAYIEEYDFEDNRGGEEKEYEIVNENIMANVPIDTDQQILAKGFIDKDGDFVIVSHDYGTHARKEQHNG